MTDWKTVQGSQPEKPQEFDITSSKSTVYQRRNIKRTTTKDGTELWEYDERTMSHDEYLVVKDLDLQSKIEYVAMMTDVDLEG